MNVLLEFHCNNVEGSYCKMAIINKLDMFAVTNLLQKSSAVASEMAIWTKQGFCKAFFNVSANSNSGFNVYFLFGIVGMII